MNIQSVIRQLALVPTHIPVVIPENIRNPRGFVEEVSGALSLNFKRSPLGLEPGDFGLPFLKRENDSYTDEVIYSMPSWVNMDGDSESILFLDTFDSPVGTSELAFLMATERTLYSNSLPSNLRIFLRYEEQFEDDIRFAKLVLGD